MESELQNLDRIIEQNKNEAQRTQKELQSEGKRGQDLANSLSILETTIRFLFKKYKYYNIIKLKRKRRRIKKFGKRIRNCKKR